MLKYCLGGIGFLFFVLIVSAKAQVFLEQLIDLPNVLEFGICAIPLVAILVSMIHDVVNRTKGFKNASLSTLAGIGVLFFFMMVANNGANFMDILAKLSPFEQGTIVAIPILALVASTVVDIALPRKTKKASS
ncbi:hypothetical protein HQ571_04420 [Candidatus Kuenenbacteria bacterium]|nr:hypothetical protein [Candidatus Kuenenbacteria bacterium]